MTRNADFEHWVKTGQDLLEHYLQQHLPAPTLAPQHLHEAMRYAVLEGGKRVRPLLALAAGELTGASVPTLIVVGASVELIHAYSLVHDDLPAMDNDVLRRGKPTCHKQFNEALALLAGDTLQSLAFQWLSDPRLALEPACQLQLVQQLALASGSRGMGGGQALDLEYTNQNPTLPELEAMHLKKTGALIRAAVLMGAHCGEPLEASAQQHLAHFANCIGLAFQVVDDVLDAEADTSVLGKTAGKDAAANKTTYASTMGLSQARLFSRELLEDALHALAQLGSRAERLQQLAHFIVHRSH